MPPATGAAWAHFTDKERTQSGNFTAKCKYCKITFRGSHTRFAMHFNPSDTSIHTCEEAPASVLEDMSAVYVAMTWLCCHRMMMDGRRADVHVPVHDHTSIHQP